MKITTTSGGLQDWLNDEWGDALAAWAWNQKSEHTRRAYIGAVRDLLSDSGKHPSELTQSDVIRWRQRLEKSGLAPATIALKLSAVSSAFEFCRRRGLSSLNPADEVRRPTVTPYGRASVLDVDSGQDVALLAAVDRSTPLGKRDYSLILLLLVTGVRVGSALAMRWDDLAPAGDGAVWSYVQKGGGVRRVLLPALVLAALDEWRAVSPAGSAGGYVFTTWRRGSGGSGRPMSSRDAVDRVRLWCDRAFGKGHGFTPHTLRHTAAVASIAAGVSAMDVSALLGHKSMRVTTIYMQHVKHSQADKAAAVLAARYAAGSDNET